MRYYLKIFWMLLLILPISIMHNAQCEIISNDNFDYQILQDGSVVISAYTGDDSNVIIPDQIDGKKVVSILGDTFIERRDIIDSVVLPEFIFILDEGLFGWCEELTEVILPDNLINISTSMFYHCSRLTKISLPQSLQSIDNWAFSYCVSLREIHIPNSVKYIGEGAFADCYNLTVVEIPEGVTTIGSRAFSSCTQLLEIVIPKSVVSIGEEAFSTYNIECIIVHRDSYAEDYCQQNNLPFQYYDDMCPDGEIYVPRKSNLYSTLDHCTYRYEELENGTIRITSINIGALRDTDSLIIPDTIAGLVVTEIVGDVDIEHETSLLSSIKSVIIPQTVTTIGDYAFAYAHSLESINIPDSVQYIGDYAFVNASSLKSIDIPDSVQHIGSASFADCYNLTELTLPNNLSHIGNNPFFASGIEKLIIASDHPLLEVVNGMLYSKPEKRLIYCFPEQISPKCELRKDIQAIDDYAFARCTSLQSISIPDTLCSMGKNPFVLCENLQEIQLSKNHPTLRVDDGILYSKIDDRLICCIDNNTHQLDIPNGIRSIDPYAFLQRTSLTDVTIPNTVISIGENAFAYCSQLQTVVLSNNMKEINQFTFYECRMLSEILIPEGITTIKNLAFRGCSNLNYVNLPNSLTKLETFSFPENISYIVQTGSYAEEYCIIHNYSYSIK